MMSLVVLPARGGLCALLLLLLLWAIFPGSSPLSVRPASLLAKSSAALAVADFVPMCDCLCCSVQICNGIDARGCLPGKEAGCLTEKKDKVFGCHTWADKNFIPVDCNPEEAWKRHKKPGKKTKMGHNEFCKDFCNAGVVPIPGKQCFENAAPTEPPPTCCPCKGVANATTPDAAAAPPGTVVVSASAASFLAREHGKVYFQSSCDPACCGFPEPRFQ